MKIISLLIAIGFSFSAFAKGEEGFVLQVDPKKYQPSKFEKGLGKKVEPMPDSSSRMIPEREDREEVFNRVPSLRPHLTAFHELDRDILFVRTKTLKLEQVQKLYPKIPAKTLAELKKAIQQKSK